MGLSPGGGTEIGWPSMQGEARVDWSSSWVGSRWLVGSGFVFDLGQRRSGLARDDFRMVLDVME